MKKMLKVVLIASMLSIVNTLSYANHGMIVVDYDGCDYKSEKTRVEYATMKEMQDAIEKLQSNGKFFGAWVQLLDGGAMMLSPNDHPGCKDE
jgi:hypothetical protein